MKKIIAINGSPRKAGSAHSVANTDTLICEAARGAQKAGSEVEHFNLFDLPPFTGCRSCFGCKTEKSRGHCVCKDSLTPLLEKIREADGLILGSPIYINEVTASTRALIERLTFQYITYKNEIKSYNTRPVPTLLIFTCGCPRSAFKATGYTRLFKTYKARFERLMGPSNYLVSDDAWQVNDYEIWGWTQFDVAAKTARHENAFPKDKAKAFKMGKALAAL
jgi:multimeric flavodoxin WrbA